HTAIVDVPSRPARPGVRLRVRGRSVDPGVHGGVRAADALPERIPGDRDRASRSGLRAERDRVRTPNDRIRDGQRHPDGAVVAHSRAAARGPTITTLLTWSIRPTVVILVRIGRRGLVLPNPGSS